MNTEQSKRIWTPVEIKQNFSNRAFVERSIVVLYNRQTVEEQRQEHTEENNGIGFNDRH